MIATNYVRHPQAMAMQRELWSKSSRDKIIMRIAGLIMRGAPVPTWWTEARRRARALSDAVRTCCRDMFEELRQADAQPTNGYSAYVRQHQRDSAARKLAHALRVVRETRYEYRAMRLAVEVAAMLAAPVTDRGLA